MTENTLHERLILAKELVVALEKGNEAGADGVLEKIADITESQLFQDVGRLTRHVQCGMSSFSMDTKINELAEKEIPNAKERLNYVISMTEQSAHQTLSAVELLVPVSEELNEQANKLAVNWERFLGRDMPFAEFKDMSVEITHYFKQSINSLASIQSGLNEILMAQGFQDITGQIIRRVIDLVQEVETSMVDLIKISGGKHFDGNAQIQPELPGPVVPGVDDKGDDVATNQDEVDDLLSSLGF